MKPISKLRNSLTFCFDICAVFAHSRNIYTRRIGAKKTFRFFLSPFFWQRKFGLFYIVFFYYFSFHYFFLESKFIFGRPRIFALIRRYYIRFWRRMRCRPISDIYALITFKWFFILKTSLVLPSFFHVFFAESVVLTGG